MKQRYTIHEHHARRAGRHFDLRLQHKNNVCSFALPKAKLPDGNGVLLAIRTHTDYDDLSALDFSGTIPSGEYGGGSLSIWETGLYTPLEWDDSTGKIIFSVPPQFGGQQLLGTYFLIRTSRSDNQYVFGKKLEK